VKAFIAAFKQANNAWAQFEKQELEARLSTIYVLVEEINKTQDRISQDAETYGSKLRSLCGEIK
jgi:hypothetical protein